MRGFQSTASLVASDPLLSVMDVFGCDGLDDACKVLSGIFLIESHCEKIRKKVTSSNTELNEVAECVCELVVLKYYDGNPIGWISFDASADVYATLTQTLLERGSVDHAVSVHSRIDEIINTSTGDELWRCAVLHYGDSVPALVVRQRGLLRIAQILALASGTMIFVSVLLGGFHGSPKHWLLLVILLGMFGFLWANNLTRSVLAICPSCVTIRDFCKSIAGNRSAQQPSLLQ